jgi:hypothetical protein
MTVPTRSLATVTALAALAAGPAPAGAQTTSPVAAVSLTVTIPPRVALLPPPVVATRGEHVVEMTTRVGFANARASRVEVSLAAGAADLGDGVRVFVRSAGGDYVPLVPGVRVTVAQAGSSFDVGLDDAGGPVTFRLESTDPARLRTVAVPVTFRLTHGRGDLASGWSVTDVLCPGQAPSR